MQGKLFEQMIRSSVPRDSTGALCGCSVWLKARFWPSRCTLAKIANCNRRCMENNDSLLLWRHNSHSWGVTPVGHHTSDIAAASSDYLVFPSPSASRDFRWQEWSGACPHGNAVKTAGAGKRVAYRYPVRSHTKQRVIKGKQTQGDTRVAGTQKSPGAVPATPRLKNAR